MGLLKDFIDPTLSCRTIDDFSLHENRGAAVLNSWCYSSDDGYI